MDTEDEAFMEQLDECIQKKDWLAACGDMSQVINLDRARIPMKLYQKDEWESLRFMYPELCDGSIEKIDWESDDSAIYRFDRFFESIRGFHEGSLDLTGRHENRYRRLIARWHRLLADVLKISTHATKTKVPLMGGHGKPFQRDGKIVMVTEYIVNRPSLLEKFDRDWKSGYLPFKYSLRHTKKLLKYLSEHPTPIFQKLLLQDLPPELIHQIMQLAERKEVRNLGSASKYFRGFALSYVYLSRHFDIPNMKEEYDPAETVEGRRSRRETEIRNRCDVLSNEMAFVLSRPDILNSIIDIAMFGYIYGIAQDMLGYERESPEYRALFGLIERQSNLVLNRTHNVKSLGLTHRLIDSDVIQAMTAMHDLEKIFISTSYLDPTIELPQLPSVISVALFMSSVENLPLWAILGSCPNLRFLRLYCSNDLDTVQPAPNIRASFNPFGSLEKLAIERFHPEDIVYLTSWIQESPHLKLTHFLLEGGKLGIFPFQTEQILFALGPAPLQVLVLDGLHHAETTLLDDIASTFPSLRSLTLLYRESLRKTRSSDSFWPHASWEYAPLLRGFQQLEFFGWNFRIVDTKRPFHRTLRSFEEGSFPKRWREAEQEEYLADSESIARVLAAYCPTLKYVVFGRHSECHISRSSNGSIVIETSSLAGFSLPIELLHEYWPRSGRSWEVTK
ncbi:hypothetical protein NLI96_g2103 [Meripilus lineatus]|uniref:F-box domain-containing protein n=1 Tax=Meripilus lineatus TaxID=2056292 RepID=A0AAD5YHR9_9APHY|nr:hypothetical protein NLI96_g2103 [Physisporinus lineatus]